MKGKVALGIVVGILFSIVGNGCTGDTLKDVSTNIVFNIDKLHNGDAKFFNDKIITSVGGEMSIYNEDGTLFKNDYGIQSNWVDVCTEDNVVIYGNFENEIGIAQFNKQYNLIQNNILWKSDNLSIDPAIIKIGEEYYFTATEIIGNINNSDVNQENGQYTVKLYKTSDLINIEYISDIVSEQYNIEDVDLIRLDNGLGLVYEKEIVDKGGSSIVIARSESDDYKDWETGRVLENPDCDHEPASFFWNGDETYSLYYSCDKENLGESYMGGNIYESKFDKNFKKLSVQKINTETNTGILLYDVQDEDKKISFLFAKNYLTDCDLVKETSHKQKK
ncbi:hypothetical protein INP51_13835 [Blautia liquoris]|uniref:Uncharacterized protein n=1 Tax=Blautia liquoris TaxID=2779518 RepID=A0A7M2RGB1_9FIRM|nr:hypothetical protein [Blautia liquoris]QOV19024.1 hypothetical protein INP51_13835 [Blautia liquoris]